MPDQTQRVALVTGAARRVGAVIARALHAAGYDVALHCRRSVKERDALVGELESRRPDSTLGLQADLADTDSLRMLVERTVSRFGRLDALVNNASSFYPTPLGEITAQQCAELFATNARAPLLLAQAAAAHLKAARGAIVNIVDIYAQRPLPRHAAYCMSKAALAIATLSLAQELGPEVRVNGVAPGAVLWPESGKEYADREKIVAHTPLQRAGTPEDIAGAVLWLLRDAPFVTGEIIRVDGGRSINL